MAALITKSRLRRLVAAIVTSLVAMFFGYTYYGFAEAQDSVKTVAALEVPQGDPAQSSLIQMQRAIAKQLAGNDADGHSLRSDAARSWVLELDTAEAADISVTHLESGRLYRAIFNHDGDALGLSAVWLAIPKGDGMPSAIVIRNNNQRAGWLSMKERKALKPLYVVERVACRSKTIIAESRHPFPPEALHSLATARSTQAMEQPESVAKLDGKCPNLNRMLPVASVRQTAELH